MRSPKRTGVLSAAILALALAGGGLVAAPAHADTAVTCNDTSSPDGTIYGCMAAQRATSWLNANGGQGVVYDVNGLWNDPSGVSYRTDCSGFVSMALHLTPTGLAALNSAEMYEANGFVDVAKDSLQQGDILTNPIAGPQGHVVLFDHWTDSSHTAYWGFEQHGPTGSYGTAYRVIQYPYDPGNGNFYPQHYTKLAGSTPPPPVAGSNASSSSTVVLR
ncbi:MAG TPA: NlpC/P60 family protein, partial [Pseudonocardiaceae bacterium]